MSIYDEICDVICLNEGISLDDITSKSRKGELVYCRQLIMYFAKQKKVGSLNFIGQKLNRDHATVLHAINSIQNYIETSRIKRDDINEYQKKIDNIINNYNTQCFDDVYMENDFYN